MVRDRTVMVRLNDEEHERLSAAASSEGATLAGYLRMSGHRLMPAEPTSNHPGEPDNLDAWAEARRRAVEGDGGFNPDGLHAWAQRLIRKRMDGDPSLSRSEAELAVSEQDLRHMSKHDRSNLLEVLRNRYEFLSGQAQEAATGIPRAYTRDEQERLGYEMSAASNAARDAGEEYRLLLSRSLENAHPELAALHDAYEEADARSAAARTVADDLMYAASDAFYAWDSCLRELSKAAYPEPLITTMGGASSQGLSEATYPEPREVE